MGARRSGRHDARRCGSTARRDSARRSARHGSTLSAAFIRATRQVAASKGDRVGTMPSHLLNLTASRLGDALVMARSTLSAPFIRATRQVAASKGGRVGTMPSHLLNLTACRLGDALVMARVNPAGTLHPRELERRTGQGQIGMARRPSWLSLPRVDPARRSCGHGSIRKRPSFGRPGGTCRRRWDREGTACAPAVPRHPPSRRHDRGSNDASASNLYPRDPAPLQSPRGPTGRSRLIGVGVFPFSFRPSGDYAFRLTPGG